MSTMSTSITEAATTSSADAATADAGSTPERPLTTADRCDACGAQAFVRVVLAAGELLFCAHHGRQNRQALERRALFIQDESSRLTQGA